MLLRLYKGENRKNDNKTISVLTSVYNTIQEIEVKGEKNCAYVVGICNVIKQHIQELQTTGDVKDDNK